MAVTFHVVLQMVHHDSPNVKQERSSLAAVHQKRHSAFALGSDREVNKPRSAKLLRPTTSFGNALPNGRPVCIDKKRATGRLLFGNCGIRIVFVFNDRNGGEGDNDVDGGPDGDKKHSKS